MTFPLVTVDLGGRFTAVCAVARTAAEQTRGLQGHPGLHPDEGMLFLYDPPRAATFHMGSVTFPIDIVFTDGGGRIAKIVHGAQPGVSTRWSHASTGAVVEIAGGTCGRAGIDVGAQVRRASGTSYNLLRTLTEAEREADLDLVDGYYSKEPGLPGGVTTPVDDRTPGSRFQDRRLPDEAFSEAMNQPNPDWVQQIGYQPTEYLEDLGVGPSMRPSAMRRTAWPRGLWRRGQIQDPGSFVATIVEAMARQQEAGQPPIQWALDPLTQRTESAQVTSGDVRGWLSGLGLNPLGRQQAMRAATSPEGWRTLGDGLVLAGIADQAKVEKDRLVLHRGVKGEPSWT